MKLNNGDNDEGRLKLSKKNAMISKFNNFIDQFQVKSGDFNYTRVSRVRGGRFFIPSNMRNKFLKFYGNVLEKTGFNPALTQFPDRIAAKPLLIDVDMRKKMSHNEQTNYSLSGDIGGINRLISRDMTEGVAQICRKIIISLFSEEQIQGKIDKGIINPHIFVMHRPRISIIESDNDEVIIKDGFHIEIPGCCISTCFGKYILEALNNYVVKCDDGILREYKYQTPDVLDGGPIDNSTAWMLYGSGKHSSPPYKINFIINLATGELEENIYNLKDLPVILGIHDRKQVLITMDPQLYHKIVTTYTVSHQMEEKNEIISVSTTDNDELTDDFINNHIGRILGWFKKSRVMEYSKWLEVGLCLGSASKKDKRVFDLWIKFSERVKQYDAKKYNYQAAVNVWKNSKPGIFTWGSLYYWLKEDNPKKFKELEIDNIVFDIIKHKGYWTDFNVARIFYKLIKDDYKSDRDWSVYQSGRGSGGYTFYEFDRSIGRWKRQTGIPIKFSIHLIPEKLRDLFISAYKKINNYMAQEMRKLENTEKMSALTLRASKIKTFLPRLGQVYYQKTLTLAVAPFIHDGDFVPKLNQKPHLFAFKNGVYDLEKRKFRQGIPDDYISVSANCPFLENHDIENCPVIKEMNKAIHEVFQKKTTYVMQLISSCLWINTNDNRMYIFWGDGSSGKSTFFEIIDESFGDYFSSLPMTYFTQKDGRSNQASPDTMQFLYKRIMCFDETNKNDTLNMRRLKSATGGNKIPGRHLFGGIIRFKQSARLMFQMNNLLKLPSTNRSISRRISVIPCKAVFIDKNSEFVHEENYEHVGKINLEMFKNIKKWATEGYFLTYLIHIHNKHNVNKKILEMPESVRKTTTEYINRNKHIRLFVNSQLRESDNKKDYIKIKDFYPAYRAWLMRNGYHHIARSIDITSVGLSLQNEYGNRYNRRRSRIYGLMFKDDVFDSNF
jgi:P4 family phage/plasmid primase-like protien